jgi:hypothetical protein
MRTTQPDRDGTRTIRGAVIAVSGAIKSGTGFTVTRNSTGNYTLRFIGLRSIITLNATVQQSGGFIVAGPTAADTATVQIFTPATALADYDWAFEATGLAR